MKIYCFSIKNLQKHLVVIEKQYIFVPEIIRNGKDPVEKGQSVWQ